MKVGVLCIKKEGVHFDTPPIDMNFVDFSMSSLMSCNVSSASLFFMF